ncbi:hypothetical protein [Rhodoglobus aureus]|uniref:Uncharacterized protein n=1 Tax=Rhodoglobus aureus TaxID=191497 RepID=A0ABN1VKS7_9MICO
MTLETAPLEGNPVIRIGKRSSELVWPNGARRRFHTPEIEQAQKELNRVIRLSKLAPTASIEQQQNRADSIFEARTQLQHAVHSYVRSFRGDSNALAV